MNRVYCLPAGDLPDSRKLGTYFALYTNPGYRDVGVIAQNWPHDLARIGFAPPEPVWDFVTIALAAIAADQAVPRDVAVDGWTREIELTVSLRDPEPWKPRLSDLESILRYLTGDFWTLRVKGDGIPVPAATVRVPRVGDCVSLLSGGIDSLIGGIDLVSDGREPLFVSQTVKGDAHTQKVYANSLGAAHRHFQWSHRIHCPVQAERSTRGRSIGFLAFGALAATVVNGYGTATVPLVVPENGFISLNVPLNSGRLGSLSTRTTHPVFMDRLQQLWSSVGIRVQLQVPYRFKTKGEMMKECLDQSLLIKLVGRSTSCSRFLRNKHTHCGKCVPCLVRRAAFLHAGLVDSTPKYKLQSLKKHGGSGADDVGAVAAACVRLAEDGPHRWCTGSLTFAQSGTRLSYESIVARGLGELQALLKQHGVL